MVVGAPNHLAARSSRRMEYSTQSRCPSKRYQFIGPDQGKYVPMEREDETERVGFHEGKRSEKDAELRDRHRNGEGDVLSR